ncbi:hypothetical protein [uncultured Mediterranean phage uvMED]|nr:hypothetical protein [uncultured Mediterranean phage uvMED]
MAPNEEVNMIFGEIVNNCLVDVWQKTELEISDHEEELFENEPQISDMPQGMIVQYIPQGLIIFFGKQEDLDGNW